MCSKKHFFLVVFIFLNSFFSISQSSDSFFLTGSFDYSFSGAAIVAGGGYQSGMSQFYLGYKHPLKSFPGGFQAGYGLVAGYRYFLNSETKVKSFINLDYQSSIQKSFFLADEKKRYNYLHQLNFNYGISYELFPDFLIGNSIGGGIYIQRLYSRVFEKRHTFLGYDGLIRFLVIYRI